MIRKDFQFVIQIPLHTENPFEKLYSFPRGNHKILCNKKKSKMDLTLKLFFQRVLVLLGVVAVALSAPQGPADKVIAIVSQEFDQQPDGSYRYR